MLSKICIFLVCISIKICKIFFNMLFITAAALDSSLAPNELMISCNLSSLKMKIQIRFAKRFYISRISAKKDHSFAETRFFRRPSYSITGSRLIFVSVKISYSSKLGVLNSEITAPSGPAWNQCFVSGTIVYCSPACKTTSWNTV